MLTLVSSLRTSLRLSQLYSFLASGEDLNLGYLSFPRLIDDPTAISYFPRSKQLVVFSVGADEVIFVDPLNRSVEKRISAQNTRPKSPSILSPQINTVFYIGEGGIDADGLFSINASGVISTILPIGEGSISKITDAILNPNDSSILLLDEDTFRIHRINSSGVLQLNYIRLNERSNELPQIEIDPLTNTLFVRDLENNAIHVIKSDGTQELINLSFQPLGITWSLKENLLYVFGILISQMAVFEWSPTTLQEVSLNAISFPGVIIGSDYDPIRESTVVKMTSSLLAKDGLLYLDLKGPTGFIYTEYDYNTPFAFVPDNNSFYIPLRSINSIRGYKALQTVNVVKRAPFSYDQLIPIDFSGRGGIFAYNGKQASIYDERFVLRNVNLEFSSLFTSISSLDNLIYATYIDIEEEQLLFLSFDNGTILAVNEQFSVIKSIPTKDLVISREGNQFSINPGVDSPYRAVGIRFSRSFKLLYIAYENGKIGADEARGMVVCYDLTQGIVDAAPIAFSEAPGEVSQITSIELNNISNHLLILGDGLNNTILRILDSVPASGRLSLLASKTSDSNTSNITIFENRAVYGSSSGQLYSMGTSVTADLSELSLTNVSYVTASRPNQFLYALDASSNYLHTLNAKIEPYGSVIFNSTPKSVVTYGDFLYVNIDSADIPLPTLSSNLTVSQPINRIDFSQSIGVDIEIGDVITLTQGADIFYLTSLSRMDASRNFIFINSFTPPVTIDSTQATLSIQGDTLYQISQTALEAQLQDFRLSFRIDKTLDQSYDNYFSSTFTPYFLTNSNEDNVFQTLEGIYYSRGDRLTNKAESPYYSYKNFIYFQTDNYELFRINLLDRSVQQVQLVDGPNLSQLKNILIKDNFLLITLNNKQKLYKFSLTESRIDRIRYTIESDLLLGYIPDKIIYNEVEDVINIYSLNKLQKIII